MRSVRRTFEHLVAPRLSLELARRPFFGRLLVTGMLSRSSVGAEIGVWQGDFSATLLERVRPAQLHLVDPWRFEASADYVEAYYGGAMARSQLDMDRIHDAVRDRFAEQVADDQVVLHRLPSIEAAKTFGDGSLDWVYIDGNHLYEHVIADLEAWGDKVRVGGVVAGDDFGVAGWWKDGVTRAVLDYVHTGSAWVEAVFHHQFVLRRQ